MQRDRHHPMSTSRGPTLHLPLGLVASGRGLRRAGQVRRDFARAYDDWLAPTHEVAEPPPDPRAST